ncbi:MAG: hypothetical protein ACTSRW_11830 [Candidatus Helarchaeota archaeon]
MSSLSDFIFVSYVINTIIGITLALIGAFINNFGQVISFPVFFWIGVVSIITGATLLARFLGE